MTNIKQMVWVVWLIAMLLVGSEPAGMGKAPQGSIYEIMEQGREQMTETSIPDATPVPTNTSVPTNTPAPTLGEKYTFVKMNTQMYAKQNVNVRSLPNTEGEVLGTLWTLDAVLVTGKCNEVNWYRVEYGNETAYVYAKYLTDVMPTPTPAPPIEYANSFCVDEDGSVYVLDLYKRKLVMTQKEPYTYISLPGSVLPADVRLLNEKFYIYDEVLNEVLVYNKDGEPLLSVPVPLENDYVKRFEPDGKEVALLTYGGKRLVLSEDLVTFFEEEYRGKTVYSEGFDFVEYLGEDASGIRYSLNTTLISDCSVLSGEIMVCASTQEGEFLYGYNLPTLDCVWLPDHYVRFTSDGEVYVLLVKEEEVVVKHVTMEQNPVSQLTQIEKEVRATEAAYLKESDKRIASKKTYRGEITLTREKVHERALAMAEYVWTLRQENVDSNVARNARLPRYIEALTMRVQGEDAWEIPMTGIPYCWGGFNSLYGSKSTRFSKVINEGYFAGNINSSGEYRSNTAGLDCSGYVSTLLGTSWKLNTRHCSDLGSRRFGLKELAQMDILVAPGDHIVLFIDWLDDGTMLATEAAIRDGRITIHPRTINSFLIESTFQMRSPW